MAFKWERKELGRVGTAGKKMMNANKRLSDFIRHQEKVFSVNFFRRTMMKQMLLVIWSFHHPPRAGKQEWTKRKIVGSLDGRPCGVLESI